MSAIINGHNLKHGGIGATGQCVAFPQVVGEAAQISPKLPEKIDIPRVQEKGEG